MLQENGIRFGKETSWQDFMAAVRACTKTSGGTNSVFGFAYAGGEPWLFLYEGLGMFMLQNGGKALSDDLRTASFSAPEVKEAARFFYDLQNSGACPRDSVTLADGTVMQDMFVSGRVAMFQGGHWALDYVLEKNPRFEVGVTLLKNRQTASSTGGWTLEIANKTRNPRAAWAVFEYIFRPENLVLFTSLMPSTIEASKLTMTDSKYDIFKEVLPNSTHPIPINKNLPEIASMIQTEMQSILLNNISLDAGLANLDRNVTALMRR
jgi:ABC-type glycerol-3-phosphate transport system substrate-binding protein